MSKQIDVSAKTVSRIIETRKPGSLIRGASRPPADSTVDCTVDFSGCTEAQIYDLAERAVVIAKQAKLRKSTNPAEWNETAWNIDASAFLRAERSTNPAADANRAFARLSDAERVALLNELSARYRAADSDESETEKDE